MQTIGPRRRRRCGFPRRPRCPSRAWGPPITGRTDCEVPDWQLTLLDSRAAPVLAFDPPKKQNHHRTGFLSLPLDVLEMIFGYMLIAPAEIYLGVVTLENRLPHHWHPAHTLRTEREPPYSEESAGRTPVCRHRRAQAPLRLCPSILSVNRELHVEAARVLYGRNAFAIDIGVPSTRKYAQHYDVSKLGLDQIVPLNPVYHKLLRRVSFRHYNYSMNTYPVRVFHSAMMHVLRDMSGAFTAFRRRYDSIGGGFDFETFAGWSPAATPTWLADASASLATSQPLITTNLSMHVDEVHPLMSTLWEKPVHSDSRAQVTRGDSCCLDLCVMSDPTIYTGPWHPDNPQSWQAARIFLVRLRNDASKHPWPDDQTHKWYSGQWYSKLQTLIVGKSKDLRLASTDQLEREIGPAGYCAWQKGPEGEKRRVFTAPMGLLVPPVCRFLREQQLKREHRRRRTGDVNLPTLPVNSEGTENHWDVWEPWIRQRFPYEYV